MLDSQDSTKSTSFGSNKRTIGRRNTPFGTVAHVKEVIQSDVVLPVR